MDFVSSGIFVYRQIKNNPCFQQNSDKYLRNADLQLILNGLDEHWY